MIDDPVHSNYSRYLYDECSASAEMRANMDSPGDKNSYTMQESSASEYVRTLLADIAYVCGSMNWRRLRLRECPHK